MHPPRGRGRVRRAVRPAEPFRDGPHTCVDRFARDRPDRHAVAVRQFVRTLAGGGVNLDAHQVRFGTCVDASTFPGRVYGSAHPILRRYYTDVSLLYQMRDQVVTTPSLLRMTST